MSNVRRRKVQAWAAFLLTFSVSLGAATAFANGPEFEPIDGDPNTLLTVTPSDNLVDGQSVSVSGTGFQRNSRVDLLMCSGTDVLICDDGIGTASTDGNGAFGPVSVNVPQIFGQFTGEPVPIFIDCAIVACRLNALAGFSFSSHHLTFATAPTSTSTTVTPTSTSTTVTPTSTSTTRLPTTTSTTVTPTSTSTTVTPTSTSTTVTPTSTSTTVTPTSTSTTRLPTTTSTTRLPTTTSTTAGASTTTIVTTPTTLCNQLREARAAFNTRVDELKQTLGRSLSGASLQRAIAEVERTRAQGNAQLDAQIARCR